MVRGSMSSTNDALSYFQDVKTFAPNLRSYEIEFEEEIPRSQTAVGFMNVCLLLNPFLDYCARL